MISQFTTVVAINVVLPDYLIIRAVSYVLKKRTLAKLVHFLF